ncbi:transmembrane protein 167 precursor, partial [Nannochloropsis gaditana CCMP526]|uniref:transmembrane protein 167 precursor n=1 Tax=Nannochloropsis gaditana (strain CCMP526) TaxID=1093141 RepID=UPI00029F5B1B
TCTAMPTQARPTHSLFRSPIRDAFQQKPKRPSCRLIAPSAEGALSKMVERNPRRYVQVTMKRRTTVIRLEKSNIAD